MNIGMQVGLAVSSLIHIAIFVTWIHEPQPVAAVHKNVPLTFDLTIKSVHLETAAEDAKRSIAQDQLVGAEPVAPVERVKPALAPITPTKPLKRNVMIPERPSPQPRLEEKSQHNEAPLNKEKKITPEQREPTPAPSLKNVIASRAPNGVAKVAEKIEVNEQLRQAAIAEQYLAELALQLNKMKHYPRSSRRLQEEGTVIIRLVLQKNGEVTELSVEASSGYERLDQVAIATAKRLSPFKSIPTALGLERWAIRVPMVFQLRL